jgi:hypothetical protein
MTDVQARFCEACGAPATAKARFCAACGSELDSVHVEGVDDARPAESDAEVETVDVREGALKGSEAEPNKSAAALEDGGRSRKLEASIVGGVVVLVAIIGLVAALSGGGDGHGSVAATPTPATPSQVEQPVDDAPDVSSDQVDDAAAESDDAPTATATVAIGKPAVDDDITFKVQSLDVVSASSIAVSDFSDPIKSRAGAKIVKAVITWKNNMSTPTDIFCGGGSAVLVDRDGNNYNPMDHLTDLAGNDICGDEVGPGFRRTDTLLFELPSKALTGSIALWNGSAEDDSQGDTYVSVEK